MAIVQNFDLNMIPESEPVIVHVNQYDTGTGRLIAHLYDGDTPYTPTGTAAIQGTKPDGKGFMYSATLSGNTVTADLKDQMSVIAGRVRCQMVVTETSGITGTFCFDLDVQESALPDDTEVSESDYPIIEELIHEAQTAAATAAEASADAENSASDSEAWAVGTRGGDPVSPSDPTYHNNSKYWAEHGGGGEGGHVIMDENGNDMPARNTLQFMNMQVTDDATHGITVVRGSKGGSKIKITTTESTLFGEDVLISDGINTYTEVFNGSGVAVFEGVLITGNLTVTSTDGVDTAEAMISVEYFGNYEKAISFFSAPITITTDSPLFFGKTVTVKDSHNVLVGSAQFTTPLSGNATATVDVPATGVYTVSCTADDGGTDSDTVSVTSQTGASVLLHLWNNALVISTTASELASAQISITKEVSGQQVPVGVASFPASGTLTTTFNVHETGIYTATVTYSGEDYSDEHEITAEGTTPFTIVTIPDGSTVTPTDTIQTWLACAGITDKAYTTLNEVLADHDTLYLLMGDDNAVDYLVRSTTWVSGITADEYAMKYIGKWNYASDTLLADSTWRTAIVGSTYASSIINASVPNMTSVNQPSGAVTSGTTSSTYSDWKAFDGDTSTFWAATNQTQSGATSAEDWIGYEFATAVECAYAVYTGVTNTAVQSYSIKASEDGTTFDIVLASGTTLASQTNQQIDFTQNVGKYKYYRMYLTQKWTGSGPGGFPRIAELQFYGRQNVTENVIDIYSAASDTVYYTDNGSDVTVCTTDSTGHGTVAKTNLPNGTYTLYSTVAKDPTNLSNDYSKTVTVTDSTTDIYFMPDGKVLYWFGYEGGEITPKPYGTSNMVGNTSFAANTPTVTKNPSNLYLTNSSGTASKYNYGTVYFEPSGIDYTSYSALKHIYKVGENIDTSGIVRLNVSSTYANGYTAVSENQYGSAYTDKYYYASINVSSITGTKYTGYQVVYYNANTNRSIYVEALWLD